MVVPFSQHAYLYSHGDCIEEVFILSRESNAEMDYFRPVIYRSSLNVLLVFKKLNFQPCARMKKNDAFLIGFANGQLRTRKKWTGPSRLATLVSHVLLLLQI